MQNILTDYIIFLLKILTTLLIFILPILFIFTKDKKEKYLNITNVNEKYTKLKIALYSEIYNKKLNKNLIKLTNQNLKEFKQKTKKNLFIINFNGDITASDINKIKDIISLLILERKHINEILIKLTSSGGLVNNYGLAASSIKLLKDKNITLTVAIDMIAASGGYMIAAMANKIIASHFAIIGSIGVIGIIPNFNKLLNNKNIEIEYHTAGEYKSTLSMLSKNTDIGRKKFIQTLENTHQLFKNFIKESRPQLDIDKVSTGEWWYGIDAINLKLIDKIQTSDEYIMEKISELNVYEIDINEKKSIKIKITESIKNITLKLLGLI